MTAQVQRASILTGRQLVLAVTIALHAAAISALMAWRIAEVMSKTPDDPIQVIDLKPDPPRIPPPGTPDRGIIEAIPYAPPVTPDVPRIDDYEERVSTIVAADDTVTGLVGSASSEPHPLPADTPLQYRATRPSDDYYPPQAIRLEQEGVTIVRTCVDTAGALSGAPQVVRSSRSRLLDAAAIAWAREALQFTPATHAGAAVAACKEFRVNFTLH